MPPPPDITQISRNTLLENDRRLSTEETKAHSTSYLANPLRPKSDLGPRAQRPPVRNANSKRKREEYVDDEIQSMSARMPLFHRGRTGSSRGTSSLHESSIVRDQRQGANQDPRLSQSLAAQDSNEREDSRPNAENDTCDSDAKFNFDPDEFNPGAKR
ncbi:unnamed protein product [Zymoseptoria tritici ST99CH_1A5]|uniref:Uncharacterized protein n=1 Tax=Zymoseptoria tritici ST99CH_1A5 TaxID=1276529 RepID=A0A1Y6LUB1_ZYMTR|nr:unnamed protein product [Zymoseptoria tritici ST99CH_1A5]